MAAYFRQVRSVSYSIQQADGEGLDHALTYLVKSQPGRLDSFGGHAALEMTMNVYGHVVLDSQREALTQLNDLLDE